MSKEDKDKCKEYIYGMILIGILIFFFYYQLYSSIIIEHCTLFCVALNTMFGFIYGIVVGFIYGLKYKIEKTED